MDLGPCRPSILEITVQSGASGVLLLGRVGATALGTPCWHPICVDTVPYLEAPMTLQEGEEEGPWPEHQP